jgi:hypothetical protein
MQGYFLLAQAIGPPWKKNMLPEVDLGCLTSPAKSASEYPTNPVLSPPTQMPQSFVPLSIQKPEGLLASAQLLGFDNILPLGQQQMQDLDEFAEPSKEKPSPSLLEFK